jgi:hypothetical protein
MKGTRELWFHPSWYEYSLEAVALRKSLFSAEEVEKWRQAKRGSKDMALKAFEEGEAGLLVASVPENDALSFVEINSELLQERGIYEASLLKAYIASKTNTHGYPWSTLKQMIECCDRAKLLAAGDPLPDPRPFTLYRGVAGKARDRRVRGISWTGTLDKAVWFATRPIVRSLVDPAVYKVEVHAKHVLAYLGSRGEDEYLVALPRSAKIDRTSWTPQKNLKPRRVSTVPATVPSERKPT